MPLYEYRCADCGQLTEVRHGFDELYAQPCEHCGGALRRVFNPAPILFKGSGFYVTDSRKKTQEAAAQKDGASAKPVAQTDAKADAPKEKSPSPDTKESAA